MTWLVKEVRLWLCLTYEPEVFSIREDHMVLRFSSVEDSVKAQEGGPWFVGGQLMAFASWVSDFISGRKPGNRSVVWLRLLELPLEYWVPSAIMAVAGEVGHPLSIDNFMDKMKKTGYARVWVELDESKPLLPGVQIQGQRSIF